MEWVLGKIVIRAAGCLIIFCTAALLRME